MPRGIRIIYPATEELIDLHWNQKLSIREIQERLGYSRESTGLYQLFKKRGIPNRNRGEAIRLRHQLHPKDWFKNKRKGDKAPNWKGGKMRHGDGYIWLYKPDYPASNKVGYVLEHRLVWEQFHNKILPKGWIVHHLNGIRDDNRAKNLIAVSRKLHDHNTFLKALQARIRELEQLHLPL